MLVVHRDLKVIVNILNVAVWYMFMTGRSGGVEAEAEGEGEEGEGYSQAECFVPCRVWILVSNVSPHLRISHFECSKQITIP